MQPHGWYLLAGLLLLIMALSITVLRRIPMTTSMVYLAVGYALGPGGMGAITLAREHAPIVEYLTEAAVLVSLFTAGVKLRLPVSDGRWLLPLRLAGPSMVLTIALVAAASVLLFDLPIGAGILLGAILAPTDPVTASDVQVEDPADRDKLRFALTGEAGLNDGTAFPFVMLGLGLLGLHELGPRGIRWFAVDLLWASAAGLVIGWVLGHLVGYAVLYLRKKHKESVGLDDFLALGLIALSYSAALYAHAYGFLAVFAAGLALRRLERKATGGAEARLEVAADPEAKHEQATDPETAPAHMAQAIVSFNEQLERLAEMVVVILLGILLSTVPFSAAYLGFAGIVMFLIRPAAAYVGLAFAPVSPLQKRLIAWFGIRGVGSVYYLAYAVSHGLPEPLVQLMVSLTVTAVAASALVHGVSATPLMNFYARRSGRRAERRLLEANKAP